MDDIPCILNDNFPTELEAQEMLDRKDIQRQPYYLLKAMRSVGERDVVVHPTAVYKWMIAPHNNTYPYKETNLKRAWERALTAEPPQSGGIPAFRTFYRPACAFEVHH
jgi:hypothetical protein